MITEREKKLLDAAKGNIQLLEQTLMYRNANGITIGNVILECSIEDTIKAIAAYDKPEEEAQTHNSELSNASGIQETKANEPFLITADLKGNVAHVAPMTPKLTIKPLSFREQLVCSALNGLIAHSDHCEQSGIPNITKLAIDFADATIELIEKPKS